MADIDITDDNAPIEPRKEKVAALIKSPYAPKQHVRNRAARLVKLIELDAPPIVVRNEMRMLLEAIEAYKWRPE